MPTFYKRNLLTSPQNEQSLFRSAQNEQALLPSAQNDEEHMLEAPHQNTEPVVAPVKPAEDNEHIIKEWLVWTAPSRPHHKRDRSFYTTVATLILLTVLISFFLQEFLLIGALLAFGFLVYVINFVTPEDIQYKLTSQGITIGDHFYHWQQLNSFWFTQKDGVDLLHILTTIRFPAMLIVVLPENRLEEIKNICVKYLPFHEIAPKTMMDKWSDGLQKHFQLEHTKS